MGCDAVQSGRNPPRYRGKTFVHVHEQVTNNKQSSVQLTKRRRKIYRSTRRDIPEVSTLRLLKHLQLTDSPTNSMILNHQSVVDSRTACHCLFACIWLFIVHVMSLSLDSNLSSTLKIVAICFSEMLMFIVTAITCEWSLELPAIFPGCGRKVAGIFAYRLTFKLSRDRNGQRGFDSL